jgi:hypothetical protein
MTDENYITLVYEFEPNFHRQLANGGYVGRQLANEYVCRWRSHTQDVREWLNLPIDGHWGVAQSSELPVYTPRMMQVDRGTFHEGRRHALVPLDSRIGHRDLRRTSALAAVRMQLYLRDGRLTHTNGL